MPYKDQRPANTINATYTVSAHDGKVGCNTIEYKLDFQYSDQLYFKMAWYKDKYHP